MKKGFTLIELLAVILILGIIALIAIPTVNNILKEARRGAFNSTLTNLEKAVEEKCTLEQIKNTEITKEYTITDGVISPSLDIKGDLPDGTITVNTNCEVSFALSDNNFTGNKDFVGDIVITDGSSIEQKYKEAILNGADPVYSSNLIPVIIEDDGTVKKANVKEKWYSYEEKWWANAVILTDAGKIEDDGTILEDSIESYFVWIPRYKYKLFNVDSMTEITAEIPADQAKSIEIVFENKNTPLSQGTEVGQYLSHPAFEAFKANGFWAGKFELTGTDENPTVKPNQTMFTNRIPDTFFKIGYDYKRSNDSHMMKNTEWGAVAYLSLSRFGINKEVNVNNHSEFKTGYAATANADQTIYPGVYGNTADLTQPYNTPVGYTASTTGNISGIYDMSGGSNEFVAGYVQYAENATANAYHSYGAQYGDGYPFDINLFGDAMREIGPIYKVDSMPYTSWFYDYAYDLDIHYTWYSRGGDYGDGIHAGQLCFYSYRPEARSHIGTRIVLVK